MKMIKFIKELFQPCLHNWKEVARLEGVGIFGEAKKRITFVCANCGKFKKINL